MLSYRHRPEPFSSGVYEIDSKRGEIGNQKFTIILPRIWRELFTSVACLDIRNFLTAVNGRNGKRLSEKSEFGFKKRLKKKKTEEKKNY